MAQAAFGAENLTVARKASNTELHPLVFLALANTHCGYLLASFVLPAKGGCMDVLIVGFLLVLALCMSACD